LKYYAKERCARIRALCGKGIRRQKLVYKERKRGTRGRVLAYLGKVHFRISNKVNQGPNEKGAKGRKESMTPERKSAMFRVFTMKRRGHQSKAMKGKGAKGVKNL